MQKDLAMTDFSQTAPARLATRLAFFAAGFSIACCAPLFPYIKGAVGADEKQFGLLLLCLGLGSIVAMPITGVLAARRGARPMVMLGGFGLVAFLPAVAMAPSPLMLGAALLVFGASLGTIDVAMNVHGAEVEAQEKRPLMSNFHAQYSIGGFCGAGFITLLLSVGLSYMLAAWLGAGIALAAMLGARGRLLGAKGGAPEPFALPRGVVLLFAVLAAITFLVEGAILDWGALLIVEVGIAEVQRAGIGFILFSVTMVIGRLTGDRLVAWAGDFAVLIWGGLAAIAGIALMLTAPWPPLALAGFALVGAGAANLVPIVFSAAGRQKVMPAGLAVASVTTTGYAGVLLGPAMIGFAADAVGLTGAFWLLAALLVAVPLSARQVART